ncbi:hypothetical protein [Dyella sp. SG609]|uniref:hypothetical protein n=1 Tax=Dyella sp. SG609 TaxID=2587018 RepID=UPI0014463388|nr:hypothetical protein [Dyella sp. SG609]NKJ20370.1 hypothetical protein [Dyella sp. SG609]
MNDFIATVSFPASLPLSLLAKKIDLAFKGLHLKKEDTGRFEEVPAYVGDSGGLEFVLFGIPEGEVSDIYILEFTHRTRQSIIELDDALDILGKNFFTEKSINERGYLDYSIELAQRLRDLGFEGVEAMTLKSE